MEKKKLNASNEPSAEVVCACFLRQKAIAIGQTLDPKFRCASTRWMSAIAVHNGALFQPTLSFSLV